MDYPDEGVSVGPSTCGLGLFSLRRLVRHELIGPIRGMVTGDPQYESDYCMELTESLTLEPAAPFRFVNHSCQPNCQLVEVEADESPPTSEGVELWMEALREIGAGEELRIDYAWPARVAKPCRCGSPRCRGWIVAVDELELVGRTKRPPPPPEE